MNKRAVLVDSTANLGEELFNHPLVYQVNLTVNTSEGKSYQDTWDRVKLSEFYTYLRDTDSLPTTSQPTPAEYHRVFNQMIDDGVTEVVGLYISSKVSGTFQTAEMVAQEYRDRLTIHNFDSYTSSRGLRNMVEHVLKFYDQNKPYENYILPRLEQIRDNTIVLAVVPDLTNLRKGGRIGHLQGVVGDVLNIKPLLKVADGEIQTLGKARGLNKAYKQLDEHLDDYIRGRAFKYHVAVVHTNNLDMAQKKVEDTKTRYNLREDRVYVDDLTIVIGTQVGEGVVAYIYCPVLD